ncbi:MAG: glycoside hydrolase family 5 protein [Chloroflexi bacterium]|nr:glycoside hydrolase family 5 protein [Chloroflexota bacterium]
MLRRVLCALGLCLSLAPPVQAASSGDGERLLAPDGAPFFVTGINYEGPVDRAWHMWDNDRFDPGAIDADFARAGAAGLTTLRLFVQAPLAVDIAAGRWDKLDAVVGLAEKHGLQLILSLHDYGERDLARVSATAGQVARRYRARPGILAFDLKNEPRFGDLSLAKYADPAPLQQRGLIDALGERLPRTQVAEYRASEDGVKTVPSYLSDDEAWMYVNNLRLYREMLVEAAAWVKDHNFQTTSLDFLDDAAGQKWAPLSAALNGTLQAWLSPQIDAIRHGDPTRSITVDHVDAVLAKLAANDALDFESLHRYPAASAGSIRATLNLLTSLEQAHPGKPYLLSEFGYATDTVDPERAGLFETAITLGLLAQHAAGGAKWMLNDMPPGFNTRERTLGAFGLDGSPKPVAGASSALRTYLRGTGSAAGTLKLDDDRDSGVRYIYRAADAVLLGGKNVDGGAVSLQADGPAQLFVTWSEPNIVRLWASTTLAATVDLGQMLGGNISADLSLSRLENGKGQPTTIGSRSANTLKLALRPGTYTLKVGTPPRRGTDYDVTGGHFFTQTNGRTESPAGFAVTDADSVPFWTAFQALGGPDVLGYPVTRRFELDGFVVQAFQKSVLQWRPERREFWFLNTFDALHDHGRDDWLEIYRQTPRPADNAADAGLAWEGVVARHLALLDKTPPVLKQRFLADPHWLDHYGLPTAITESSNSVVVRAQRATLQYWKEAVPWAAKGSVSIANGGDLAKEAGLFPWLAVSPENAPR